jgi:hypothetical protein
LKNRFGQFPSCDAQKNPYEFFKECSLHDESLHSKFVEQSRKGVSNFCFRMGMLNRAQGDGWGAMVMAVVVHGSQISLARQLLRRRHANLLLRAILLKKKQANMFHLRPFVKW